MTIATATIQPNNIYARHSSGAIVIPQSVKAVGENYQYVLERNWQPTDSGIWELFLDSAHAILDDAGNAIPAQKIGEITVSIVGVSQYLVVLNLDGLGSSDTLVIDRELEDADFDDSSWIQAQQAIRDFTAWTWKTQLYFRTGRREVKPMFPDIVEPMPPASHNNAIALGGDMFTNRLPNGVTVTYSTPKTAQDSDDLITFPASNFSHFQFFFVDQAGVKIGNFGSNKTVLGSAFTGQTVTTKAPYPSGTVAIRFVLTRSGDGSELTYDVPVA
jgi:hypothetical protein